MYCSHYLGGPAHGLVGVFDSNGLYHVFTDTGLWVDTLGMDSFRHGLDKTGMYAQSGESWYGAHYLNKDNGKVYLFMGRAQLTVYEVDGWTPSTVRPLTIESPTLRLTARHVGTPNPIALALRGGKGAAPVAEFRAALGGPPALDGSLAGWKTSLPVTFGLDAERRAEVRGMFDRDHLYLRWHVRQPGGFTPVAANDLTRIFTHERGADTFSFYLQGDPDALPGRETGRPGDVRCVLARTPDGPRALGLYPQSATKKPVTYRSPVREVTFDRVEVLDTVSATLTRDADGQGVVLSAAIPSAAIPGFGNLTRGLQTFGNFEVTLRGRTKFWWANTGGADNTLTTDEPSEAQLYPGSWAPVRFAW